MSLRRTASKLKDDVLKRATLRNRNGEGKATLHMSVFAGKTMEDIDGTTVYLNRLARKVTLVVNVACFCTFTKQYPGLQELQRKFGPSQLFTVLAFPCNQFGEKEPESESQIKEFVQKFAVTFPLLCKSDVNGPGENEVYRELKAVFPGEVPWNFTKFLVVDGVVVQRYEPSVLPEEIEKDIAAYVAA